LRSYNVAVVGASGAVGREMVKILEEKNFPVNNLKLLATRRSAGTEICYRGESAGGGPSKEIAPIAVEEGAIVIDNSNAFRMDDNVPLVVPEINPEDIAKHQGIIANPNCSTIQMVVALKPIYDQVGIERIIVSTYQAVSGTGKKAIDELNKQIEDYLKGNKLESIVYPYQIAFNVLPHIDIFEDNGYTREEMKMVRESRKILHDSRLAITATCARVPVFFGHSEAVNIETRNKIDIADIKKLLDQAEGVKVIDNPDQISYPLAIMSENDDDVLVGRIREDISTRNGISMWIVGHNLRKGAALNAVQIAERLI